jgi:hypothetical protein
MSFLPANLWGLHPLYLADVPLFCAHLSGHLFSSPELPRDSHFLYGAHPLRSVEVGGVATLVTRRKGGKQVVAFLDDGTGSIAQLSLFARDDGSPLPFARGAALLARGALGWAFRQGGVSSEMVREVRVGAGGLRVLRGGGGGLNELAAWWARAARLHRVLFRQPLQALMPSCAPLPAALRRDVVGGSGNDGGGVAAAAPAGAAAAAVGPGGLPPAQLSPASQEDALRQRLVFALQAAIAAHHPLSLDSAGAVSALQAAAYERARRLHAQVAAALAAGRAAGGSGGEGSDDDEEEEEEEEEGGEGGVEGAGDDDEGWAAAEEPFALGVGTAGARGAAAAPAAEVDFMNVDTEPETEEEEERGGAGAAGAARVRAPAPAPPRPPAVCMDDGAAQDDAAIAAALAEGRWVVGNLAAPAATPTAAAAAPAAARAAPLAPPAPAAPQIPHLPELFTAFQALELLLLAEPAQAAELRAWALQRWAAAAPQAVGDCAIEALDSLVRDGVLFRAPPAPALPGSLPSQRSGGSSGDFFSASSSGEQPAAPRGGATLYGVVTHVHLLAPTTLRVLRRHGSRWDGMEAAAPAEGEAGGEGPLTVAALVKEMLAEDARLKAVPLSVLRSSWELLQSDGSILFPTPNTVALA